METHSHPKKSSWLFVVGGIFLILVVVLVALKILAAASPAIDEDAARSAERTKAHQDLMAEDKVKLETFAWADKAKGHVQIPIKQAMEMVVASSAGKTPTAAGPITPLAPPPSVEPASAGTAAPAPSPAASPQSQNP
jgi:hypothetical protein